MFLVSLTYIKPLAEVEKHLAEHVAFLNKCYAAKKFVVSGRKVPRTGGVILAYNCSLAELQALLQEDPFHRHAIAAYEITEFEPSMSAQAFEAFVS
ncbi:YciI family protein [Pontibacter mangrovi]|uniref:GTP cyclohydrolase n=1 Tax=Pontibacter mangrovi TaxID=2589816 RepID=A0A501W7U6_9BACT|nr:YciI family protein [Pontibacter mangrovi]TPE45388.1 GTP cyclohydrolase [Pontibacter mangrovi]